MARPDPGGFAANARREAHQILSGSQYQSHPQKTFDPLGGVIRTVGRWLGYIFDRPWKWVSHQFSGAFGAWWPVVAGLLLVTLGVFIGHYVIRRRQRFDFERPGAVSLVTEQDPAYLDRLADDAELQEDWKTAIRLRFRAGILRLDRVGAIDRGTTKTTRQISSVLGSEQFDVLAGDLESIVYAGAVATRAQAVVAKQTWPVVVFEAERGVGSRIRAA